MDTAYAETSYKQSTEMRRSGWTCCNQADTKFQKPMQIPDGSVIKAANDDDYGSACATAVKEHTTGSRASVDSFPIPTRHLLQDQTGFETEPHPVTSNLDTPFLRSRGMQLKLSMRAVN